MEICRGSEDLGDGQGGIILEERSKIYIEIIRPRGGRASCQRSVKNKSKGLKDRVL